LGKYLSTYTSNKRRYAQVISLYHFPHLFATTSGSPFHHGTKQAVLLPQPHFCSKFGSLKCGVRAAISGEAMDSLCCVAVFIVCSVRKELLWLENNEWE